MTNRPLPNCMILRAERASYAPIEREMRRLQRLRVGGQIDDAIIFVEHDEVVTVGRRAQLTGIAPPAGYATQEVDRGGGLTWHGPGQLTVYPIIAWTLLGERSIRGVIERLEDWIIAALARLGVEGGRDERMRGVWAGGHKVASIGLNFDHWVSRHGLSINFATPTDRVEAVACCGLSPGTTTSLSALFSRQFTRQQIEQALLATIEPTIARRPTRQLSAGDDFTWDVPCGSGVENGTKPVAR